jgi:hypothetical protein
VFIKYLSTISISVCMIMNGSIALAAAKTKHKISKVTKAKSKISKNKSVAIKLAAGSALAGATAIAATETSNTPFTTYMCEENVSFDLSGDTAIDKQLILKLHKVQYNVERISTDTGAQRFTTNNKMYDLIILGQTSMIMNNQSGQRVAKNCMPNSTANANNTAVK